MKRRYLGRGGVVVFGHWIPFAVAALVGLTLIFAILADQWRPLFAAGVLIPRAVLAGEVWRLVIWVFLDTQLGSLVVACLIVAWLGPAVCQAWGARRFVGLYFACAIATGGLTSLLALALPSEWLLDAGFVSAWSIVGALIIAWASLFADRQVLLNFVVPLKGQTLIWLTVAITVVLAVSQGWQVQTPHLIAEGLALLYLDRLVFVRRIWLRLRLAAYERELRKRTSHLRVVRRDGDERPPRYH